MLEYITNSLDNVQEWKNDLIESENWRYYVRERAVFQGLPIAVISSIAAAYLFQATSIKTAAIFGTFNYVALTSTLELLRKHYQIDPLKGAAIVGLCGVVTMAFLQTVCQINLSYRAIIILSTAAFVGQLARQFFVSEME